MCNRTFPKHIAGEENPDKTSTSICAKCLFCDEGSSFLYQTVEDVVEVIQGELKDGYQWQGPEKEYKDKERVEEFDRFYENAKAEIHAERSAELGKK